MIRIEIKKTNPAFVRAIKKEIAQTKQDHEKIFASIKKGLHEAELIHSGKKEGKSFDQFLKELKDN